MDVYSLTLHSNERNYSNSDQFALEFDYKISVSKKTIVDASIDELSKAPNVGPAETKAWKEILERGISDMQAGEKASVVFSRSGNVEFWSENGFWTSPISRWDKMFSSGVRAAYFASSQAARKMTEQKSGIIFNLSFWAAQRNDKGVAYCTSKAATDKMTEAMAYELYKFDIPVISLYPGIVRTEAVLENKEHFDLSNSESPEFVGMVISKIASDKKAIEKTGKILIVAKEAMKYGIKDIDGKQPKPLSLDEI